MENVFQTCNRCLTSLPLSAFHLDKWKSRGVYTICKICRKSKKSPVSEESRIKRNERNRLARANITPEQREKNRIWKREYYRKNRESIRKYETNRIRQSKKVLISNQLRKRLNMAIRNKTKTGSAVRDLGCSMEQFLYYIEGLFQPGMTWDNYGKGGWHLDHIRPLSSFNLENPEEFKLAAHYTNLQPLWEFDNLKKSNKYGKARNQLQVGTASEPDATA